MRRDTAANWTSNDPTLLSGEMGYETDTHKIKIGDGSTVWTSLSYFDSGGFQAPQTVDDESATLASGVIYQAATDGFVNVWSAEESWVTKYIQGKVGPANPPVTIMQKHQQNTTQTTGLVLGFPVPVDYFWKIEKSNVTTVTIIWTPMGSGSVAPITP